MTTAAADTYQAFRLNDQIVAQGGISGGSIAGPLGETIDLLELLEDTEHGGEDGVIVTDDPVVINALGGLPQFVAADLPDTFDPPVSDDGSPAEVDERSGKPDLVAAAEQRGLDSSGTKAELLERVQAHDRETQPGYVLVGAEAIALAEGTPGALRTDGTVTPDDAEPAPDAGGGQQGGEGSTGTTGEGN